MKRVLCAGAFLLFIAFTAQAEQVLFPDVERNDPGVAFYMDRDGDLYPPASVHVDTGSMLNGGDSGRPTVATSDPAFATLKGLYRWKSSRQSPEWVALLSHAKVEASGNFDRDWISIQDALRQRVIADIKGIDADQVVLLIHGFNNNHDAALAWYTPLQQSLAHGRPDVRFVRMYWDGLSGLGLGTWPRAQYNGPGVGQELRRILSGLGDSIRLRVFTHSSGAFVMANALGDGTASFDPGDIQEEFRLRATGGLGYPLPTNLRDLRVAMLVPAQPLSAFHNYRQGAAGVVPARLILGNSRSDSATGKYPFIPCRFYGDTCMSVKVRDACRTVRTDLGIDPPRLLVVDFPKRVFMHGHGVSTYMSDPQWPQLVRALLDEDPGMPDGTTRWCDLPA